jgi:hypothetical protein
MLDRLIKPFLDYWYWAQDRETPLTRGLALAAPLVSFALVLYLLFGRGGDGSLPDVPTTQDNVAEATQPPGQATQPAGTGAVGEASPTPGAGGATGATGATGPAVPEPTAFDQMRYTVVEGDTPGGIAEKVGVPADIRQTWVQEMLALNGIDETSLPLGEEIILPPF